MTHAVAILLVSLLGQAPAEYLEAARELAPLLGGIERRLPSEVTVRPGALPPSPFSGQRATLFAFRVTKERPLLTPATEKAIADLLAWQKSPRQHPGTAPLAGAWAEYLVAAVEDLLAEAPAGAEACDLPCVVSLLADPSDAFGATPLERQQTRDVILLEAIALAAADQTPPR
ncbi:MAG: hypothetical protein Q8L86_07680 [Vicinamibacterales bacterium]|nr:hypothetical protein [Vicinamibacterales bacterium]